MSPIKLLYLVPITFTEAKKDDAASEFFIEGVAINETITRNGVQYVAEELEKAAPSLMGRPVLKDHRNEVDAIVGRVKHASWDAKEKHIKFRAQIMDEKAKEMIRDGRINNVSIGGGVKQMVSEEKEGQKWRRAVGLEIFELSLVPVPGDANASIAQAMEEAYSMFNKAESPADSDKIVEGKSMDEDVKAKLDEAAKENASLKARLVEMEKAETLKLREEYEGEAKRVGAKVVETESKETLKALIGSLKDVKPAEAKAAEKATKGVVGETKEAPALAEDWAAYRVENRLNGGIALFRLRESHNRAGMKVTPSQ